MAEKKAIFNWSGGKDSALALYYLSKNPDFEVTALLTSFNSDLGRVSMHGIRHQLILKQAQSLSLPLNLLSLPGEVTMEEYDHLMKEKMADFVQEGVTHSVFGDIFLEDLRNYREEKLKELGLQGHFPIWKRDTRELVQEFLELGFRTQVVSVDGSKLDQSFVGRELDGGFLNDLPSDVDPCGENGEFHTFVFDGPIFKESIKFKVGDVVRRTYKLDTKADAEVIYWFQDLLPI